MSSEFRRRRSGNPKFVFTMAMFAAAGPAPAAVVADQADYAGLWHGVATGPAGYVRFLMIRVAPRSQPSLDFAVKFDGDWARFPSPDLSFKDGGMSFRGEVAGRKIEIRCRTGKRSGTASGELIAAGTKSRLELEKLDVQTSDEKETMQQPASNEWLERCRTHSESERSRLRRIQMYANPPYDVRPVVFRSADQKTSFAGVLTAPKGKGPFPAVVLLGGAGPGDCDCSNGDEFRPFRRLADELTRRGVVVLRAHTRGLCGSGGGHYYLATLDELADDALGAVRFLESQPTVDAKRIGLFGMSGGGTIAGMVAARRPQTAFIVMAETPFTDGEDFYVAAVRAGADNCTPEHRQDMIGLRHRLAEVARSKDGPAERLRRRRSIAAKWLVEQGSLFAALFSDVVDSYAKLEDELPWNRSFLCYDPAENLKRVRCPVFAFFGELDTTVPPAAHLPRCRELLRNSDRRSKIEVIPRLTHSLAIADDKCDDASFSPELLANVCDWICMAAKPQTGGAPTERPPASSIAKSPSAAQGTAAKPK